MAASLSAPERNPGSHGQPPVSNPARLLSLNVTDTQCADDVLLALASAAAGLESLRASQTEVTTAVSVGASVACALRVTLGTHGSPPAPPLCR